MTKPKPQAFTLVELLVVISIIGMLMALLLPAIGSMMEHARRTTCINNQHEIYLAITTYETRKGRYPGYRNAIGNQSVSWAVAIMKNLGRGDIYDSWADPTHPKPDQVRRVNQLLCPGDSQDTLGSEALTYQVNSGKYSEGGAQDRPSQRPYDRRMHGVFHNHGMVGGNPPTAAEIETVSLDYIASHDGTMVTLLLSEDIRATLWTETSEDRLGCFWYRDSSDQPVNRADPNTGLLLTDTSTSHASATRLSSTHPGGVVVTMCDGHTFFMTERINPKQYRILLTPFGQGAIHQDDGTANPDPDALLIIEDLMP